MQGRLCIATWLTWHKIETFCYQSGQVGSAAPTASPTSQQLPQHEFTQSLGNPADRLLWTLDGFAEEKEASSQGLLVTGPVVTHSSRPRVSCGQPDWEGLQFGVSPMPRGAEVGQWPHPRCPWGEGMPEAHSLAHVPMRGYSKPDKTSGLHNATQTHSDGKSVCVQI